MPKKAFALQTGNLSSTLGQLKWKLKMMSELKRAGKKANDPKVIELDHANMELLLSQKSGMRNVIDSVENLKLKS